jgi:hypothetical protein
MSTQSIHFPPSRARTANERAVDAFTWLRDQMEDALQNEPSRKVPSPSWGPKHPETPADDLILDGFAGTGDTSLAELLGMVAAAARGENVQQTARLWISVQAAKYANHQRDDLLAREEGEFDNDDGRDE